MSLIRAAAEKNSLLKVKALVEEGADVNAAPVNGWTALMSAGANANAEVAELLLQRGANVNARDGAGWSILACTIGCRKEHLLIVKMLLEYGADVYAENFGITARMLAAEKGCTEIEAILAAEEVWQRRKALLVSRYSE